MIRPHLKSRLFVNGKPFMAIVPLRVVPGIVEDDFGTAADPRRALATDRRFVSTNDDLGHAGRAA